MNMEGQLRRIFQAALSAVDPGRLVRERVSLAKGLLRLRGEGADTTLDLRSFEQILVLGAGKAAAPMAAALESVLGERIGEGLVVVKEGYRAALARIRCLEAGHPVPDERGLAAAEAMEALAASANARTLVLVLLSGGGSALLPAPVHPISLQDKQEVTGSLLASGATIAEINCLRKHLSRLKGGRLVSRLGGAQVVSLILSDVVGDRLDTIASGLTAPDESTFSQAAAIVSKYGLSLPSPVANLLAEGLRGDVGETPKPGDPAFERVTNILIGNNRTGLEAAAREAEVLGWRSVVLTSRIVGEAREVGKVYAAIALDQRRHGSLGAGNVCILAGGETTVTVRGTGLGGRNQECALSFLAELAAAGPWVDGIDFLAASSDGGDGPTDAAGAFAESGLLAEARRLGLNIGDYLRENDSYRFFAAVGGLFKTGPTLTNVCDYQICLVGG